MRSFTSARPSWSASSRRAASTTSRRSSDSMPQGSSKTVSSQVRIHPVSGLWSLVRSSLSTSRSTAVRTCSGRSRLVQLGPVVVGVGPVALAVAQLAQLLADGLELAAQQELALCLLHALLDVGLDALAQRQVGQGVAGPSEHQAQPRLDVDRLENLDLLGQGQVGRVPGHVGQPARLGHVAQLRGDAPGAPTEQDVLQHGAVLAGQLSGGRRGLVLIEEVGLDPQRGRRSRARRCRWWPDPSPRWPRPGGLRAGRLPR